MVSDKNLAELASSVELLTQRFRAIRDRSEAAMEIASALEVLQSTVAVHRIRTEIINSKHPFALNSRQENPSADYIVSAQSEEVRPLHVALAEQRMPQERR